MVPIYSVFHLKKKNCQLKEKKNTFQRFQPQSPSSFKKYKYIFYLRKIKRLLAHASQPKFITLDLS